MCVGENNENEAEQEWRSGKKQDKRNSSRGIKLDGKNTGARQRSTVSRWEGYARRS